MPQGIGEEYRGQWAIYCCAMLAHALGNIATLYPDEATACRERMARLVDMAATPAMRRYDTMLWHEDAMEGLAGKKHHMSYLSLLAWMMTNYRLAGGDDRYDAQMGALIDALACRMRTSRYELNLLTFPGKPIFLPDMLVTLVALRAYGRLVDGRHADVVEEWLELAREKWLHRPTGLLRSMLPTSKRPQRPLPLRGSYAALNCSYLTLVDEAFAREQYLRLKATFSLTTNIMGQDVCGVREYQRALPALSLRAGDAGLVVKGLSAGGTAFALGAATWLGDWEFRSQLLRTADIAGGTIKRDGRRHYRLTRTFMVGEATALAMRTQVKR